VLGAHAKNNTVGRLLRSFQDQLSLRRQRTPHKINTLIHLFNLSNVSSFPPPSTESAEDPADPERTEMNAAERTSYFAQPDRFTLEIANRHVALRGVLDLVSRIRARTNCDHLTVTEQAFQLGLPSLQKTS
jgi:hypothetical protein